MDESAPTRTVEPEVSSSTPVGLQTKAPIFTRSLEARGGWLASIRDPNYLEVLRVDHWFKNVFVSVGWLAGLVSTGASLGLETIFSCAVAITAACFVSSINYIVNAVADAPFDAHHPVKCERALPAGRVRQEWLVLWALFFLAGTVCCLTSMSVPGGLWLGALLIAGLIYNIPPVRAKDVPYMDVISESVNNPIRIMIGWHAVGLATTTPPMSLLVLSWVFGAYLMTAKRFAELRFLGDEAAAAYRPTFGHYGSRSLFSVMGLYGVFSLILFARMAWDRGDLVYGIPLVAIFLVWFTWIAFDEDSMVKDPEKLFRKPFFFTYSLVSFLVIVALAR